MITTDAMQFVQLATSCGVMLVGILWLARRVLASLAQLERRVDAMHVAIAEVTSRFGEAPHTWIDQQRIAEARQQERDRAADARADAARKRAEEAAARLPRAVVVPCLSG